MNIGRSDFSLTNSYKNQFLLKILQRNHWFNYLFILATFLLFFFSAFKVIARPITLVTVDPVITLNQTEEQEFIGKVISLEGGDISSEISGIVEKINVNPGDIVTEGDIIAELDLERLTLEKNLKKSDLNSATAKVEANNTVIKQAKLNLERQKSLKGSPAFSRAIYEDLQNKLIEEQANLQSAEAEMSEAKANYEIAKLNLDRAIIKAPFSGIVTAKYIHPGVFVNSGSRVISLVNNIKTEIEFDLPKSLMSNIKPNNELRIKLGSDKIQKATVRAIILQENTLSRTVTVRLIPSEELKKQLIVNQSLIVVISKQTDKQSITVHKDALISTPFGFSVFIVNKKNMVEPRPIQIGNYYGNRVEVINGLKESELAVIKGNERLRPGQEVKFKKNGK